MAHSRILSILSIWHPIILVVMAALAFGTGKLSRIEPYLGVAIRGFKKSMNGEECRYFLAQDQLAAKVLSSERRVRQDNHEIVSKPNLTAFTSV